jgi:uncharacterized protein (TIGR02611 family)
VKSLTTLLPKPVESPLRRAFALIGGAALLKLARQLIVFVLGVCVLLVGLVMIVTPGPAILVIPLGLAILATEFVWARRILDSVKQKLRRKTAKPTIDNPDRVPLELVAAERPALPVR